MSKLLISEHPLQVLPALATIIGVNEAIVLQQVHYWIEKSIIIVNNKKWVYNTFEDWHKQFPFWSLRTLKNIFISLQKQDLIIAKQLSKDKFNKTNYYSINYLLLEKIDQKITAKKLKEIEEKSVDFLENSIDSIDSANIAQSTNINSSIDSANIAQSYIVKSFDRDYLTETTTETTLSNEQNEIQKAESDEDKSSKVQEQKEQKQNHIFFTSFDHFVNFMRANYQNKEIIHAQDKYNKTNSIISVTSKGMLYNKKDNETYQATRAKEIWQYLYTLYQNNDLIVNEEITPC